MTDNAEIETAAFDDDSLDDDNIASGPDYLWFQRPAPSHLFTFSFASTLLLLTLIAYYRRVKVLKNKLGREFHGSVLFCTLVSAYLDNDEPTFAVARLATKSLFFLGLLQLDYHLGFVIMMIVLLLESSMDATRILLAYRNCRSIRDVHATSQDEAKELLAASTTLEPTNVYEDLTRSRLIAIMVFLVQSLLIGIVMFDSYSTPTRTCFNGTADVCPMLASLGSYCLYYMGTFMACVFYVGPLNSYGKKEHDPVFWLKLFLMSKQAGAVLSWKDPVTDKRMKVKVKDWRIWLRFVMSFLVNSVCFHFLLHVLPIQIASKSSIMGVVFSSVGMIYLVDLDDTSGTVMTLLPDEEVPTINAGSDGYESVGNASDFEAEKQRIIDEALEEVKRKLEALGQVKPHHQNALPIKSITYAMFMSAQKKDDNPKRGNYEETPLV